MHIRITLMHMHTYIHTHEHTHTHIRITYTRACTYTHMNILTHAGARVYTHVELYLFQTKQVDVLSCKNQALCDLIYIRCILLLMISHVSEDSALRNT